MKPLGKKIDKSLAKLWIKTAPKPVSKAEAKRIQEAFE